MIESGETATLAQDGAGGVGQARRTLSDALRHNMLRGSRPRCSRTFTASPKSAFVPDLCRAGVGCPPWKN